MTSILVKALEPFAKMYKELTEIKLQQGGIVFQYNNASITVADLLNATNALSLYSQSKEGDWVKVEDELPPSGEVMWIWDGKEVSEWRFNGQAGKTNEEKKKYLDKYNITHWAYFDMPEPPKK